MVAQLNVFIVVFFIVFLALSAIGLVAISPGIAKDVKRAKIAKANNTRITSKEQTMSSLMEELSRCRDRSRVEQLTGMILENIHETEQLTKSSIQMRQAEKIRTWLNQFDISQHINDLRTSGVSQQVQFDTEKKDFKLLIVKR